MRVTGMERVQEAARRLRRLAEARRRALLLLVGVAFLLLYLAPALRSLLREDDSRRTDLAAQCRAERLAPFGRALAERDAYSPPEDGAAPLLAPYVGNGFFAVALDADARFNVKSGRTLSLPVEFRPVVTVDDYAMTETTVVDYLSGIVHKFQCSPFGYAVSHKFYAHRTMPSLFVQEIRATNPTANVVELALTPARVLDWPTAVGRTRRLGRGSSARDYNVRAGMVDPHRPDGYVVAVGVASRILPPSLSLKAEGSVAIDALTAIEYGEPVPRDRYAEERDAVEKRAIAAAERAIEVSDGVEGRLRDSHSAVWRRLWDTGLSISESKAADAINGDRINATVYAVLSQARSLEAEDGISAQRKAEIVRSLTYAEGCYEGHYTLQAENLWKPPESLARLNAVVGAWLLTLEKRGCHNLLKAGASGAAQAMALSFGGFRFSNQHLEFNVRPSDLHRDFHFRRINYGNSTHVNVTVVVEEDNAAALYVALDRSDGTYYACDAGCLDSPAPLGPVGKRFPVKLTDPLTAVLYVTSDREHMEDLRHTIHVKEVVVAPAHERQLIALHRHGHSLGGLPTMFWVSICIIIVVFHLFLCRIIMTEYCDPPDKYRRLYSKP